MLFFDDAIHIREPRLGEETDVRPIDSDMRKLSRLAELQEIGLELRGSGQTATVAFHHLANPGGGAYVVPFKAGQTQVRGQWEKLD